MANTLFRPEALSAQKVDWIGKVVITTPISFAFMTFCAFLAGLVLVAFLTWGECTKRSTIKGQLIPDKGLVQSYTSVAGVVIEKHVHEGQTVKAGDILYKISTTRHTDTGSVQEAIDKTFLSNGAISLSIHPVLTGNLTQTPSIVLAAVMIVIFGFFACSPFFIR